MTKLGVFTSCHINSLYREKNAPKFRNLCKISLNIYLSMAKVHFLLKLICNLYFLYLDKSDIILISNLLFNS